VGDRFYSSKHHHHTYLGTDWSLVCRRMKKDFRMPSLENENFDAIHVCTDEEDINRTISLLTTGKY
jgi:hypothetical protein